MKTGYDDGSDASDRIRGYIDRLGDRIEGWVCHSGQKTVRCRIDDRDIPVPATLYRADVRDAGWGDGFCGFYIDTPPELRDGQFHSFSLEVPGYSGFTFPDCPGQILLGIPAFAINLLHPDETEACREFWRTHLLLETGQPVDVTDEDFDFLTEPGLVLGIRAHERVIGFSLLEPKRLSGYRHVAVLRIALLKPYRHRGLGRHLLQATLELAGVSGYRRIELTVNVNNRAARRLYDRFGFLEEGRLRAHYFDGHHYADEWIMARCLAMDNQ